MFKFAKIALFTMVLVVGAVSTPAFAAGERGVAAGETLARQMLKLMDADKDGKVSRQEFMRFMEAEFDRLDVDHNGELTVREISRFPSVGPGCVCHFGYGGNDCVTAVACQAEGGRCIKSCPAQFKE